MSDPILVLSRATPHHHTGGMETLAWNLVLEWARVGRAVRVVTTAVPGRDGPFTEDGVEVVPLPGTRHGKYSRGWWRAARAYWDGLAAAPGGVLSVSAAAFSIVPHRWRFPETPFVMQAHGTSANEISSKLRSHTPRSVATLPKNVRGLVWDLSHYRDFDRIVAVGQPVADSLLTRPLSWVVDRDRVCLIPNGVRVSGYGFDPGARREVRRALGIDDSKAIVACVGRLHVQKGLDRALAAAAALRDRGQGAAFRMLFVGDGPDEARLRTLAQDLQLAEMVHFAGRIGWDAVRDYYSAADVALLTSAWREGSPLTVLEALASGLPCVVPTGYGAGLGDWVHEVDPAKPGQIADALHAAAARSAGPGESVALRESRLPDRLTMEHCATSYLALFDNLVGAGRT